jgi:hypothetical protein
MLNSVAVGVNVVIVFVFPILVENPVEFFVFGHSSSKKRNRHLAMAVQGHWSATTQRIIVLFLICLLRSSPVAKPIRIQS